MIILTIRTDKPDAEIGLYDNEVKLEYLTWTAHRQLAETIHQKIEGILKKQSKNWQDINAVACFKGPGSFTGLRIGLTVANALAYSLQIPVVGASEENWLHNSIHALLDGENDIQINPEYGRDVHITKPKK